MASVAVFFAGLAGTGILGFFLGLILVGPHADILPRILRVPVALLLWALVLGIPLWLAWITYKKLTPAGKS